MKKIAIIALAATICASMSAQPLKQNIMEGYNVSDALEKPWAHIKPILYPAGVNS